jgi:hypothetical protein
MTAHELLNFLEKAKREYERVYPERRGAAAWPTRREITYNINRGREWFPNDRGEMSVTFNRTFTDCRKNGWLEQKPCSSNCHARHIVMTAKGRAQLEEWRKQGCLYCPDHRDRLDRVVIDAKEVA